MSAVSESIMQRTTLGHLVEHYGWDLVPAFAADVTVTSLADDIDSVSPGALLKAPEDADAALVAEARRRGAYAIIAPHTARAAIGEDADLPVLYAAPTDAQFGQLAAQMAGGPSNTLAVFAVSAATPRESVAVVERLARFLHMLGNPVGIVSVGGSCSLERPLDLDYPLGVLDLQRTLAVCAEDGAAAVVIALDDMTVTSHALEAVNVDVFGSTAEPEDDGRAMIERMRAEYGFRSDEQMRVTHRTDESDTLAELAARGDDPEDKPLLSLAIAMVLAAGVRRNNIRNALRVAGDLG